MSFHSIFARIFACALSCMKPLKEGAGRLSCMLMVGFSHVDRSEASCGVRMCAPRDYYAFWSCESVFGLVCPAEVHNASHGTYGDSMIPSLVYAPMRSEGCNA